MQLTAPSGRPLVATAEIKQSTADLSLRRWLWTLNDHLVNFGLGRVFTDSENQVAHSAARSWTCCQSASLACGCLPLYSWLASAAMRSAWHCWQMCSEQCPAQSHCS